LKKPKCKVVGQDGNVFFILGSARKALKKAKLYEEAEKMTKEVTSAKSYDEALVVMSNYVEFC
jgi:hypothetical protein